MKVVMKVCCYWLILLLDTKETIKVMRFSIFVSFLWPEHNVFTVEGGVALQPEHWS